MASNDVLTKCGICLSQFTDPKILPCFHTFCLKCLEYNVQVTDSIEKFTCPICRTSVIIPEGGVKCFQTNFYIQTTATVACESDCDICGTKEAASWRCKQCEQIVCQTCAEDHTLEHDLVSVKHRTEKQHVSCKVHPSEALSEFCNNCKEAICNVCKIKLHTTHSCHLISKEASIKRTKLKHILEKAKVKMDESKRDLQVVNRQAISKHKYFDDQIAYLRNVKDKIISNINQEYNKMTVTIKQLNEEQLQLSQEVQENEQSKIAETNEFLEQVETLAAQEQDLTFITMFESMNEKLHELELKVNSEIVEKVTPVSGNILMETVEHCNVWLLKLQECTSNVNKT